MKLTVHIQTVPSRRAHIEQVMMPALRKGSGYIVDLTVWTDHLHQGPRWNALRIWDAISGDDYPGLVLQDDVYIHAYFWEHLLDLWGFIERCESVVSLYASPRAAMEEAYREGHNLVASRNMLGMPATVVSPEFAKGLSRFAAFPGKPAFASCDAMLRDYVQSIPGLRGYITVPSLVQHDINAVSTMGHPRKPGGVLRRSEVWQRNIPPGYFKVPRVCEE